MQSLNIVFIGATRFGFRCLELIHRLLGLKVTGVVTAPQTFAISYRPQGVSNILYADIANFAADHGIPSRTLERSMADPGLLDDVAAWRPDAFVVAGWYHMLPKAWRQLAPAYGLHASLLPDYSGGAPLVWAIINGEARTGITLFKMDDGVDSGPIVAQQEEPILPDDTIATLYARIEERGLSLLADALPRLADGSAVLRPQLDGMRRVMPQRSPEDGKIDWYTDSEAIDRFVRAQTRPYPGAFSTFAGAHVTIWAARSIMGQVPPSPVGTVLHVDGKCGVVCRNGLLLLDQVAIDGEEFSAVKLLGKIQPGERLGT